MSCKWGGNHTILIVPLQVTLLSICPLAFTLMMRAFQAGLAVWIFEAVMSWMAHCLKQDLKNFW